VKREELLAIAGEKVDVDRGMEETREGKESGDTWEWWTTYLERWDCAYVYEAARRKWVAVCVGSSSKYDDDPAGRGQS